MTLQQLVLAKRGSDMIEHPAGVRHPISEAGVEFRTTLCQILCSHSVYIIGLANFQTRLYLLLSLS